ARTGWNGMARDGPPLLVEPVPGSVRQPSAMPRSAHYISCARPGGRCEARGRTMRAHLTNLSAAVAGAAGIALLTALCATSVGPAAASVQPAPTARSGWGSAKNIPHLNA